MALLFKYTMPSDLTEWTTTVVGSGDLAWASGAGLGGTSGGASFTINDTAAMYMQESADVTSTTDYRYAFYIRDVSLSLPASAAFECAWVHTAGTRLHFLEIVESSGTLLLSANLRNDASTDNKATTPLGGTGASGAFYEVHVHKAATNSSSDAYCKVYKDGDYDTPVINITGIDLFDSWSGSLFRIGANIGLDSGTTGVFYLDEVSFRTDATQIGPNNTAPTVTVPATHRATIGVAEVVSGISITDPDAGDLTLTVEATYGTFTAPTPTNVDVTGSGTGTLTLTGTATELNTYLSAGNGPTYTHTTDNHTSDTITVTIDDGVASPASDTIAVTAVDWKITGASLAAVNETFQALQVTASEVGSTTLSLYTEDSGGRTGTTSTILTISNALIGLWSLLQKRRRKWI